MDFQLNRLSTICNGTLCNIPLYSDNGFIIGCFIFFNGSASIWQISSDLAPRWKIDSDFLLLGGFADKFKKIDFCQQKTIIFR